MALFSNTTFTLSTNSSNPRNSMVSLRPLGSRHNGHVFSIASGPLNQSLMHDSQPSSCLQHLDTMSGGVGIPWHIWHLNASRTRRLKPSGNLVWGVRLSISLIVSFISSISSPMSSIFFSNFCFLQWGRLLLLKSDSSSEMS